MSFKEIKDERLELQKYKAGYNAMCVLIPLNVAIAFTIHGVLGFETHWVLLLTFLPFFVGMGIYHYYAREYEELDEEQRTVKIVTQKRTRAVLAKRIAFMVFWMGCIHYFLMSKGKEQDVWMSVLFGIISGIGVGLIEYYYIRSNFKKHKENEDV